MQMISKLITNQTPILHLESNCNMHRDQMQELLSSHNVIKYMKMVYYYQNDSYYYKEKHGDLWNLILLIEELLGSYFASMKSLPTVQYSFAQVHGKYGIVSKNFKTDENRYYRLEQLGLKQGKKMNISRLKTFCNSVENQEKLEKHLLDTIALDLYMLQLDRNSNNIQFQKNKFTGYFDIAPLYDYECSGYGMPFYKLYLEHCLINIHRFHLQYLGKHYPYFLESLQFWMDQSMSQAWEQIADNYHLNLDSPLYTNIWHYYQEKEKNQKVLLHKVLKSIT